MSEWIPAEVEASWAVECLGGPCPDSWDLEAWEQRLVWAERVARFAAAMAAEARAGIFDAHSHDGLAEWAPETIAVAEECSSRGAQSRLDWSLTLADHLPVTWHLLSAGRLPVATARMLSEQVLSLTGEQCRVLEGRLWPDGLRTVPADSARRAGQLRRRVRALLPAITGAGLGEVQAAAGRSARRVEVWDGDPGSDTAVIAATLAAPDAVAVLKTLDAYAEARCPQDPRGVDEARADALVELVTGQSSFALWADTGRAGPMPQAGHWTAAVTVGLDVLLAAGTAPGVLERSGPVSAETARLVAQAAVDAGGRIARLVTDPTTGILRDHTLIPQQRPARPSIATIIEPQYEPSAALAAFVRARDRHCRFPGCGIPAARCELDHTTPWDPDDPTAQTTATNLSCLCKHHYRLKHSPGWALRQDPDGTLTWTTPTARTIHLQPRGPTDT